jgi:hypothetical protein
MGQGIEANSSMPLSLRFAITPPDSCVYNRYLGLFAVNLRGGAKRYTVLEHDGDAAAALIVKLAERHDPRGSAIFPFEPDVCADRHRAPAISGTAFVWQSEPGSADPVRKPGLGGDFAHTFTARCSNHVVGNSRHIPFLM